MTCQTIKLEDGTRAIVCTRGRGKRARCKCGKAAALLCDWKMPAKRSGTCDEPMCAGCALEVAADKHVCRTHQDAYKAWLAMRPR